MDLLFGHNRISGTKKNSLQDQVILNKLLLYSCRWLDGFR